MVTLEQGALDWRKARKGRGSISDHFRAIHPQHSELLPPRPQRYAGLFRCRLKHGLSALSTVIVTRMASIVLFAVTTVRATPFRISVMPTSPVMAAVVAALPVPVGRSVDPRINFPSRLDDDGRSHSYARRRDHEW